MSFLIIIHISRIDLIEATVFAEKANDQFTEIRERILDIEKSRAERESEIRKNS